MKVKEAGGKVLDQPAMPAQRCSVQGGTVDDVCMVRT